MCFNDPENELDEAKDRGDKDLDQFLLSLALCHTVVVDNSKDEGEDQKRKYSAASPDELALVNFAKQAGYVFKGEDDNNKVMIETPNGVLTYTLLHVCRFTSQRKRMSVIVKD